MAFEAPNALPVVVALGSSCVCVESCGIYIAAWVVLRVDTLSAAGVQHPYHCARVNTHSQTLLVSLAPHILRSPEYLAWTDVSGDYRSSSNSSNDSSSSSGPGSCAADMWSFAAIALHMATGQPPLSDLSQQRACVLIGAQRQLPLDTPTTTLPCVPAALKQLIRACLNPDPSARPSAASALQVRLCVCACGLMVIDKRQPVSDKDSTR